MVPSYVRWDAAFAYEADNYKVELNLDNLFNERYYEKALFLGGLPGEEKEPRTQCSLSVLTRRLRALFLSSWVLIGGL